jgi:recombination protein RecA
MDEKRLERLKKICNQINKQVDKAGIFPLGSTEREELKRFSSGIPSLDEAIGGGWPLGRMVEIFGGESSGKSTLCYHAISEFQKAFPDEDVAYIDSEFSFDAKYAEDVGVNVDQILFQQPETGEDAFNVIDCLFKAGVKMVIVDSVAALTPRVELEKDIGEVSMGTTARLMSQGLKRLAAETSKADGFLMFTNQIRDKIGVIGWGEKTTTSGGKALPFYASIRVKLASMGTEKEGDVAICSKVKAVIKKNKTAPPLREAQFSITYGIGVDSIADLFDTALRLGIVTKAGAWYSYGAQRLGQGRAACLVLFRETPAMLEKLKQDLLTAKQNTKNVSIKKPKIAEDSDSSTETEVESTDEEISVEDV